jgi:hypothetical protein
MKVLFGLAAGAVVFAHGGDVGEALAKEGEVDAAASQDAECWCKSLRETLESRDRAASFELRHLGSFKESQSAGNNVLRMEVAKHNEEAASHQQSIASGSALADKKAAAYDEDKSERDQSLKAIRKAMAALPEGSDGSAMHGALRGLKDKFESHQKQAESENTGRMDDLLDAKAEMLKLANGQAEAKTQRLADGMSEVARASSEITLYSAQQDTDRSLGAAVEDICTRLSEEAAERQKLRQSAQIAVSQVKVDQAQNAWLRAANKVLLSSKARVQEARQQGEAAEPLEEQKEFAKELNDIVSHSSEIEGKMAKNLQAMVMDAHLIVNVMDKTAPSVKTAVEKLGDTAKANREAMPELFNKVRAAGKKCMLADMKLVTQLRLSQANAAASKYD